MNSLVKTIPNVKKYKTYLDDVSKEISPMMISGMTDSGKNCSRLSSCPTFKFNIF